VAYPEGMTPKVVLCVVIGHRWLVDEASEEVEPVLCCVRCGRKQLAPNATGFDARIAAQTKADRWIGPTGGRR